MIAIRIEGLGLWFGEGLDRVDAVRGAGFEVAQGESFGHVGQSGSGKSTILRAITGLAPHWSGTIEVEGARLHGAKHDRRFYKRV
ncbi:ATP-binding cassette domain-containing protein [Jannaschia seohaensis]|uniref:Peptide/nickel transport system ATP-binding protein n=1 Tax=Jannaschia seohaensis TaxID=475081 RepID=A0A2Y9A7F9_9RHOB|nr:peptide/nickel transport system ATP-binding protein [Jannaschia seohaensis]SSA38107.1 peptide/nickel transport system ATP-binding protein [Jannaschia seohaensis]